MARLSIFITNLGKYNEGKLIGEWINLPTDKKKYKELLDHIGIGSFDSFGAPYEETFATDMECDYLDAPKIFGEFPDYSELNYMASVVDDLSEEDKEKLEAVIESGLTNVKTAKDIIDIAENIDDFIFYPEVETYEELGEMAAEKGYINIPEDLYNFIDFESLGRCYDMDINNGGFSESGYIDASGFCDIQYDFEVPEEYIL